MARESKFFVAGGTLRPNVPSYVKRPSDDELFSLALEGEFCYVLTPRQMGKSSLMVRTARRLENEDVRSVIIDLTEIGIVSIDKWYLGLITEIKRSLRLQVDVSQWWSENQHLGQPQRFRDFLQDIVLTEVESQIVIFIDEIDSTLKLDFRDDFFAVIRAFYNSRSRNPELGRLSFVLLGVASPSDLIEDRTRTPFNIGHEINLKEISYDDAIVLIDRLNYIFPNHGEAIFDRIYYWTSGHPYLTQKLCVSITQNPDVKWEDLEVDSLVNRTFITDEARGETNIQFVSDLITTHSKKVAMIKIYRRIYQGKKVEEEKTSPAQSALKLSGLIKVEADELVVRNQIYHDAFDLGWVKEHTAVNWQLLVTIASLTFAFILVGILGVNAYQNYTADNAELDFLQGESPEMRAKALTTLFEMRQLPIIGNSKDSRAYDLFFELDSWEDQAAIFESAEENQLILLVQKIYVTMALVDKNNDNSRYALEKMLVELKNIKSTQEVRNLIEELDAWLLAREEFQQNQIDESLVYYDQAIQLNSQNPATRFERVRVLIIREEYERAAIDLDLIMAIANETLMPEPTAIPTVQQTLSALDSVEYPIPQTPISIDGAYPLPNTNTLTTGYPYPDEANGSTIENRDTLDSSELVEPLPREPSRLIFPSEFVTRGQIKRTISEIINEYSTLADYLRNAPSNSYFNLQESNLIPYFEIFEGPFEQEPNNLASEESNGPIISGQVYFGGFQSVDDQMDYYSIVLERDNSISISLTNIPENEDFDLVLRDRNLTEIETSTNFGDQSEQIETAILPIGTYYIQVYKFLGSGSGQLYNLEANFESPP